MSRALNEFCSRAMGARIVCVDEVHEHLAYVEFEHTGTDDDSFRLVIDIRGIEWRDPATGEFSRAANSQSRGGA